MAANSSSRDLQIAQRAVFVGSLETDWKAVPIASPLTGNTGSGKVLAVGSYVTGGLSTTARRFIVIPFGTSALIRMRYGAVGCASQDPTIQLLGIDRNLNYHWLKNGNAEQVATITAVGSSDIKTGIGSSYYRYTDVSKFTIFDLQGCSYFMVFTNREAIGSTRTKSGIRYEYKLV